MSAPESPLQGCSHFEPRLVSGATRKSHFRPLRDLYRITSHVVKQVWGYGNVMREYRITRAHPPVIHDPSGEFGTVFDAPRMPRAG